MTTQLRWDGNEPRIVEFVSAEDRAKAADLARYWDATVTGQPAAPSTLDQELTLVVQLLRHYHGLTRLHRDAPATTSFQPSAPHTDRSSSVAHFSSPSAFDRSEWREPARTLTRATVGLVAIFMVVFAINTWTSPRSWLVTENDPDWIPWVSDDWIGSVWEGL